MKEDFGDIRCTRKWQHEITAHYSAPQTLSLKRDEEGLSVRELNVLDEMKDWKAKPKELIVYLTENVTKDPSLFPQLIEILKTGTDSQKGTSADVIEQLSKEKPDVVAPYIDELIGYINYKAPRVKWATSESVGNLSKNYCEEIEKAIPNLLANTADKGTVVRWATAFALGEIAKNCPATRSSLLPKINEILKTEENNGVKNIYVKALKTISKENRK